MHILIGGGSGHIGKLLTSYLKQRGHKVTWISRFSGEDRITWQQLRWDEAPKDVEAIINLAGNRWMERPSMMQSTNFQATDVIERFQTSRWFTAKTCALYCKERAEQGNPLKVYVQASSTMYYHVNQETEDLMDVVQ